MNNNSRKKYILFLSLVTISIAVIGWWYTQSSDYIEKEAARKEAKKEKRLPAQDKKDSKKQERTPSSSKVQPTSNNSSAPNIRKPAAIPANPVAPDWQEKALALIQSNLDEESKVEFLEVKPHLYQKHHLVLNTHKVKVKITCGDGLSSSYMAMVNSTTGTIMQTWNPTHFERRAHLYEAIEAVPLTAHEE